MAYLGQRDERLPVTLPELVRRESVMGYPIDFSAMGEDSQQRLMLRGEQLTRTLVEALLGLERRPHSYPLLREQHPCRIAEIEREYGWDGSKDDPVK